MKTKQNRIVTLHVEEFPIQVTYKRIKNLHLTVRPPAGEIRISAPIYLNEREIRDFAQSRLEWIRKHTERIRTLTPEIPQLYVSGEKIKFRGDTFTLQLKVSSNGNIVQISGDTILLSVQEEYDSSKREALLKEWMRQDLKTRTEPLICRWSGKIGEFPAFWNIRKMKTKWGSCHTSKKRIWLNLDLAMVSDSCLEYVIVHELIHLLEGNHGPRFRKLMDCHLPDWRNLKRELNCCTL